MSRIVFATLGSFGDLHPQIAIASELQKRGHQIVFATHQEYQGKIEALGFQFQRMRPDNTAMDDPEEMARLMDLKTGTEYLFKEVICGTLRETYTDLAEAAKDADFIVTGEVVLAARLVAEKLGIPWAFAVLQPFSFLSAYDPSVIPLLPFIAKLRGFGSIVNKGVVQLLKMMSKSWSEPIHQLRSELGLPKLKGNPFIDDKYSPYLVLAMFSSAFAKPQPDWASNTIVTGFTFYDGNGDGAKLTPELEEFLNAGAPPIVFTLGSAAVISPGRFYEESIEAAKILNRRAVLLIGKNSPPENLSADAIAVDYAPYSQIFPRACAIVHQGGIGTTAQALRAGRPMVVMPYSHDQPDNAARVERLGTSRTIPRSQYSAAKAAQTLREVLENPKYAANTAKIASIIQSEDGVAAACDAIERQIQMFREISKERRYGEAGTRDR